ncbi:MAG: hypothetical protein A2X86_14490 [Bdellovibrionales bacterium GWA2_49_15]|nr:MAG: hypothetical protein A2X86_14490 [Bdellovibrionales bacterium GWA2_49_15]HAZ13823.1 hypothetical protein [Bdellovibrionales bacterium]
MENLKILTIFLLVLICACGKEKTIKETIKLRTDTFISSISNSNNADLSYLSLANNATKEERIIVRLPTSNEDDKTLFNNCFDLDNVCSVFFMPVAILVNILTSCSNAILQPANLTSAILIFNTNDGSSVASGALNINLLTKPWFHSVTWSTAHPFSSKGKWVSQGGDFDTSTSFNANCVGLSSGACAAGEIKFEMTDYFKALISAPNTIHYGMGIRANTALNEVNIYSVQASSSLSPRIEASYTGSCSSLEVSEKHVYYLSENLP